MPNALVWRAAMALRVQKICLANGESRVIGGIVTGHSTPAVRDVGCASVRVKLDEELEDGGYLLALQSGKHTEKGQPFSRSTVPAIAAVPGDKGALLFP